MFKRLFSRSRMTRECPVRFYEGPQGLTKGSTHQKLLLSLMLLLAAGASSNLLAFCFPGVPACMGGLPCPPSGCCPGDSSCD